MVIIFFFSPEKKGKEGNAYRENECIKDYSLGTEFRPPPLDL